MHHKATKSSQRKSRSPPSRRRSRSPGGRQRRCQKPQPNEAQCSKGEGPAQPPGNKGSNVPAGATIPAKAKLKGQGRGAPCLKPCNGTASVKSDVDNDTNSALVVDRDTARCRLLHREMKTIEDLQAQAGTLKLISCRVRCQSQHQRTKTIASQKACHECA